MLKFLSTVCLMMIGIAIAPNFSYACGHTIQQMEQSVDEEKLSDQSLCCSQTHSLADHEHDCEDSCQCPIACISVTGLCGNMHHFEYFSFRAYVKVYPGPDRVLLSAAYPIWHPPQL